MKIAIVVHGRFHAFDLALALLRQGHEVTVFTNYPRWAAKRFGVPESWVRSLWIHGLFLRLVEMVPGALRWQWMESFVHRWFGRWAALQVSRQDWDVVHCWSGVSEELLLGNKGKRTETWLMRGSAHIRVQAALLEDEERRVDRRIDKPSPWMIAREEREYQLATSIRLASTFAFRSFVEQGVPESRLRLLLLGANIDTFKVPPSEIEARQRRILDRQPIRVLYVGNVTFQKGVQDLSAIVAKLGAPQFQFRIVGAVNEECIPLMEKIKDRVHMVGKVQQYLLLHEYSWADIFVFPTIQDGFAVVLSQAQACGLPILTTTNCAGPDMIREGETGWILPIRSPQLFIERLLWCDNHRKELAEMVRRTYYDCRPRNWDDVVRDFVKPLQATIPVAPTSQAQA